MTQTDHFEAGVATLARDSIDQFKDKAPWTVNGVAIPVNTIVNGGQGVDHFYPENVLEGAGELLEGKPIVKNFHELEGQASADDVIGEVTSVGYQKGVGLVFEGEITDPSIAQKVKQGYLDVSPTPARSLGEFDETMGGQRVERLVDFRDLAIVANGQPGAMVEMGPNPAVEALSRDALSRGFDVLQEDMDLMSETDTNSEDTLATDTKTVAGVTFDDADEGELDESEIPNDDFESHYLYPGDTKSESSYPVVDGDGVLRKGNVEAAWQLGARGGIDEDEHDNKLMDLADEFDDPPDFAMEDEENDSMAVVETVEVEETESDRVIELIK